MESATIAIITTTVINTLLPFLKKGAEKLTEKGAEEAFSKRVEIWSKVKGLFPVNDLTTLHLFEENPEDLKNQGMFEGELKHLLKANPETAKELDALLKQLPALQTKHNMINIKGNNNTALQDISGSNIKIYK